MRVNNKLHRYLSLLFWLNIIILVTGFLLLIWSQFPNFGVSSEPNVTFERYSIIVTLASIPFALKMFHSLLEKGKSLSADKYQKRYTYLYIIRIVILDLAAAMNIFGLYYYGENNFIYMASVIILAIMFCYPSKELTNNLTLEEVIEPVEECSVEENIKDYHKDNTNQ